MNNLFSINYYGNSLAQWAISFSLILFSILVGRVLYWAIGNWVKRLVKFTSSDLDDILVDLLEEPLVAVFVLLGTRYALNRLQFTESVQTWLDSGFRVLLILVATWLIVRIHDAMHRRYLEPFVQKSETDLDDQLLPILRSGFRFILFALGIILALNNAGYDVGAVLAGLGIGGLAFALAAQDFVSNLFGGVMIFLGRPFKLGDRIRVLGSEGYVRTIGIRTTLIETFSGAKIMLPNQVFISQTLENLDVAAWYYQEEIFRLHRETTIEQIEQFMQTITAALASDPNLFWAEAVMLRVGDYSYDVQLMYGVTQWKPSQTYYNHLYKLSILRSQVTLLALHLVEQQGLKLAVPTMVASYTPLHPLLPNEALHNGTSHTGSLVTPAANS